MYRANVTGLATPRDYELAFGGRVGEQREDLCGSASLFLAARDQGLLVGGIASVAAYPPDQPLPEELDAEIGQVNEVVEASGAQVLEMRENGGTRAEEFSVRGRRDRGVLMLALGDAQGSAVRNMTWEQGERGHWQLSGVANSSATRVGFARWTYEAMVADFSGLLPPIDTEDLKAALTADRQHDRSDGVWISSAAVATLMRRKAS